MPSYIQYPGFFGKPYISAAQSGSSAVKLTGGVVLGVSLASLQDTRLFGYGYGYPYLGVHNVYNENKPNPNGTPYNTGVAKSISAGKFATMTQNKYVILGFTSQIAGVASTLLNSPGLAYGGKSQNLANKYRNTWLKNSTGGWYYVSGRPINSQNSRDIVSNEVNPTYANPGRISYMQGALTPLTKSYQAKTD